MDTTANTAAAVTGRTSAAKLSSKRNRQERGEKRPGKQCAPAGSLVWELLEVGVLEVLFERRLSPVPDDVAPGIVLDDVGIG